MSFLYAGLGVAMLSGIMAMMQIGNNVDKFIQSLDKVNINQDDYFESEYISNDKEIIKLLYKDSLVEDDICNYLSININEKLNTVKYKAKLISTSSNKFFTQSCALIHLDGKHRVVVQTIDDKYHHFSCFSEKKEDDDYVCKFEIK